MSISEIEPRNVFVKRNKGQYEIFTKKWGTYCEQGRRVNIRALTDYLFSTPKLAVEFENGILNDVEKCLNERRSRKENLQKIYSLLTKLQEKNGYKSRLQS